MENATETTSAVENASDSELPTASIEGSAEETENATGESADVVSANGSAPAEDQEGNGHAVNADAVNGDAASAGETSDGEDLDDEDLDLIEENTGIRRPAKRQFKRLLKRKDSEREDAVEAAAPPAQRARTELNRIFDSDDEEETSKEQAQEPAETAEEKPKFSYDARQEQEMFDNDDDDDDDLGDFIVHDEDDEDIGQQQTRPRVERQRAKLQRSRPSALIAASAGISNEAWNEIYELFGDGTDYAYAMGNENEDRMDEDAESVPTKRLEDIYEPAEVEEKMFTDRDDEIRATDLPERFQLQEVPYRSPAEGELQSEAMWIAMIYKKKHLLREELTADHPLVTTIEKILGFMRVDCLEVPFILRHRRDYFQSRFNEEDIWEIYDCNARWNHILQRKAAIRKWSVIIPELESLLAGASDENDVKDLSDYLQCRYKKEMEEWKESEGNQGTGNGKMTSKYKRPVRKDLYMLAKEAGLAEFGKHFGVSAREFGVNFHENYRQHNVEDHTEEPRVLAEQFKCTQFNTVDSVIKATHAYLAQEMASDLLVRSTLREFVERTATVTTIPTDRGKTEIDENHECYTFKYLRKKPVERFDDAQFLLIYRAQKQGLLNYEIHIEASEIQRIYEMYYLSDGFSSNAEVWNEERRHILKIAFEDNLLPMAKRWLSEKLLTGATDFVIKKCRDSFAEALKLAPFRPPGDEDQDLGIRVFAISCGGGGIESSTFGVLLNEKGEHIDHIQLLHIHGKNREQRMKDCEKLKEFFRRYSKMDVIVISGWSLEVRQLLTEVPPIAESVFREKAVPVLLVRDDVARIYQNSKRAIAAYPTFHPLLRYCISLGRSLQEPLFEYAGLFNSEREALFLKFHPLQDHVPKERLYSALERVMIDTVNKVGFDINRALSSTVATSTGQFVCGLGARKFANLLSKIRAKTSVLESRGDLIQEMQMGKIVFVNCASFIRVNPESVARRRDTVVDVLDNTRIHPEDYSLARKMAADALDIAEAAPDEEADNPSHYVEEVMNQAGKLNELLLDDYAKELERQTGEPKRLTLEMIKREMQEPYRDHRDPFRPPGVDEIFTMLTGESDSSLRPGMIIATPVARVKDNLVIVRLESGLEGIIGMRNLADGMVHNAGEVVKEGEVLRCRVMSVNKERFSVELSSRESALADRESRMLDIRRDPYFDVDAERVETSSKKSTGRRRAFEHRSIKHPLFQNINHREAEKYLESRLAGDCVVRPSSQGKNFLAITWKVADGVYQHIEIKESRKDNEYTIGKELTIGKERFSDLDEIAALHIDPMASLVRQISSQNKFRNDDLDKIYELLEKQMLADPKRIPYLMGIAADLPGKFYLAYKLSAKRPPRHELITVTPSGFRFRSTMFKDIVQLLNSFKANPMMTDSRSAPVSAPSRVVPTQSMPPSSYPHSGAPPPAMARGPYPSQAPVSHFAPPYYGGPPPAGPPLGPYGRAPVPPPRQPAYGMSMGPGPGGYPTAGPPPPAMRQPYAGPPPPAQRGPPPPSSRRFTFEPSESGW